MGKENKKELTIVIPALNEEALIGITVEETLAAADEFLDNYEIFLVNDGSIDRTAEIMKKIASGRSEIKVIHHATPLGLGMVFHEGLNKANYKNFVILTGDNEISYDSLRKLFKAVGASEFILGYRNNRMQARLFHRYLLSILFNISMAIATGYKILDFHGIPIYPVRCVRDLVDLRLVGVTYQVEVITKLLRKDIDYIQVPFSINKEAYGSSQMLRLPIFIDIFNMVLHLIFSRK
jgi:dolichol-phosphate mannosyltransferase